MPAKLQEFDRHAFQAFDELVNWMDENREGLIALARGRHFIGHLLYNDTLMFEYDDRRLLVESAEEVADAINYFTRRRQLNAKDDLG